VAAVTDIGKATYYQRFEISAENSPLERYNKHMKKKTRLPLEYTAQLPCILQLPAASHFQMCPMATLHPSKIQNKYKNTNSSP
jgi:hypothetical protein